MNLEHAVLYIFRDLVGKHFSDTTFAVSTTFGGVSELHFLNQITKLNGTTFVNFKGVLAINAGLIVASTAN